MFTVLVYYVDILPCREGEVLESSMFGLLVMEDTGEITALVMVMLLVFILCLLVVPPPDWRVLTM